MNWTIIHLRDNINNGSVAEPESNHLQTTNAATDLEVTNIVISSDNPSHLEQNEVFTWSISLHLWQVYCVIISSYISTCFIFCFFKSTIMHASITGIAYSCIFLKFVLKICFLIIIKCFSCIWSWKIVLLVMTLEFYLGIYKGLELLLSKII